MKNKKAWIIGTAMGLSTVMLATVAFAGTAATSGYDALKAMMRTRNTVEAKNATVDMTVSVTEEGQPLVLVDAVMKVDAAQEKMSGSVSVSGSGVDRTMTVFKSGETAYFNISGSDTWFRSDRTDETGMEGGMGARGAHGRMSGFGSDDARFDMKGDMAMDPNAVKFAESLLDAVMGDLKHAVVLEENGTEKTFSLRIDQSNMPELLKAALAAGACQKRDAVADEVCMSDKDLADLGNPVAEAQLKALLPEMKALHDAVNLTENVTVESIDLSFTVDADNQPVASNASLIVSGKAADGGAHTYAIDIAAKTGAIGSTVPDTFDAEGKDIQVVKTPVHDKAE